MGDEPSEMDPDPMAREINLAVNNAMITDDEGAGGVGEPVGVG